MYKHLRLTALIMMIALILTPTSVLADQVSSPFRCSECGGEPHIDPAACIQYAHASDCPCQKCVTERESDSDPLGLDDDDSIWNRYIKPTITTYIPEPLVNFIEDNLEHIGNAAEAATQMGGPPNPMNAR